MQNLAFNKVTLQPINKNSQIWLSSSDLANALGYAKTDSVTKLYNRHIDEFSSNMTQVIEVSETVNLTAPNNNQNLIKKVRIFNLRGCHLVAMFAKTKIAKQFRKWVLDILDKEVGQPVQRHTISETQAHAISKVVKQKCQHNKLHYQTLYHALYDEFGITSYKELLAVDFEAAMAFIVGYEFAPVLNVALIQNILADTAYQNKKAQHEIDGIVHVIKGLLHHIEDVQNRLNHSERCVTALQQRFIA